MPYLPNGTFAESQDEYIARLERENAEARREIERVSGEPPGVSAASQRRACEGSYATISTVNERRFPVEYAPSSAVLFRRYAAG